MKVSLCKQCPYYSNKSYITGGKTYWYSHCNKAKIPCRYVPQSACAIEYSHGRYWLPNIAQTTKE